MDRINKIREYLQSTPEDNFLKHALALEYIKTGNDKEAGKLFNEILQNDPAYLGSYYHFGKLLEREGNIRDALKMYDCGMEVAKAAGDQHSYNELRAAREGAGEE